MAAESYSCCCNSSIRTWSCATEIFDMVLLMSISPFMGAYKQYARIVSRDHSTYDGRRPLHNGLRQLFIRGDQSLANSYRTMYTWQSPTSARHSHDLSSKSCSFGQIAARWLVTSLTIGRAIIAGQFYVWTQAGASPRIFEWGGQIVGRVANLPQNTLKIEKTPDFGHFILESGGSNDPIFKSAGVRTPRPPRRRRPWTQVWYRGVPSLYWAIGQEIAPKCTKLTSLDARLLYYKVCSVGKSDRRRYVTQGNPLRPSEWGFQMGCFPNIYDDFCTFSCFSLDTEDRIFQWSNSYRFVMYTYGARAL